MSKTTTEQLIELRFGATVDQLIRDGISRGMSLSEIGEDFGVTRTSVLNYARKYGIKSPGKRRLSDRPRTVFLAPRQQQTA